MNFIYKIKSPFDIGHEFIQVEKEYWKKHHDIKPFVTISKLIKDNRSEKNHIIHYLVEEGLNFLRRKRFREALIILFDLDSCTNEEFDDIEKIMTPANYLKKLLDINPNSVYESSFRFLTMNKLREGL